MTKPLLRNHKIFAGSEFPRLDLYNLNGFYWGSGVEDPYVVHNHTTFCEWVCFKNLINVFKHHRYEKLQIDIYLPKANFKLFEDLSAHTMGSPPKMLYCGALQFKYNSGFLAWDWRNDEWVEVKQPLTTPCPDIVDGLTYLNLFLFEDTNRKMFKDYLKTLFTKTVQFHYLPFREGVGAAKLYQVIDRYIDEQSERLNSFFKAWQVSCKLATTDEDRLLQPFVTDMFQKAKAQSVLKELWM